MTCVSQMMHDNAVIIIGFSSIPPGRNRFVLQAYVLNKWEVERVGPTAFKGLIMVEDEEGNSFDVVV
jgi:hypothetical protein